MEQPITVYIIQVKNYLSESYRFAKTSLRTFNISTFYQILYCDD